MSDLPKIWQIKKLRKIITTIESSSRPKGGVRSIKEGIPSLGGEHLNNEGGFNLKNIRYVPEKFYSRLKKGKIKSGDILIVKDGATTGKTSFVNSSFPFKKATVNEHIFIIRSNNSEVLSKFLFHFLFSNSGQDQIKKTFHGSAQGGINTQFVDFVNIPFPPILVQKRVIAKIDKLFEKIDKAKSLRQKALEETASIFPSALHQIFSKAKEKGWAIKKLDEVCIINPSKRELNNTPDNLEVSFISMPAVDEVSGSIVSQKVKLLKEVKKGYTYFREGDVLFAKITPCMENGKSAIAKNLINDIGFGSTEFHVLRPHKEILPEWIYFFIRQPSFRKEAKRDFIGTAGQQRVPKEFLERAEIPFPLLPEQRQIVAYLDTLRKKVEKLQRLQQEAQKEIDDLKKSILNKAFKGEL